MISIDMTLDIVTGILGGYIVGMVLTVFIFAMLGTFTPRPHKEKDDAQS